jgi:eukaryotic-like serine/threonine-protein kinase
VVTANEPERVEKKGCVTCSNEFGNEHTVCPHDGTRLTPLNQTDLIGTVLDGRYEMQEVLGGGGMGLIYKAKHRLMNRTVAIKVLHKENVTSGDSLKRFRLEAEAVSSLSTPNILTVYDFGVSDQGQPYMVMDYLAGQSLEDVLDAEEHIDSLRGIAIFKQVCLALEHAHDKNIVHRDLKPSNIMLIDYGGQSDFVKIVDFGIAKLLGREDAKLEQLTRTGEIFGSPLFMSPEQCRGQPLDCRTDIYSLGSVMYVTLSGKPLFEVENVLEMFFKQSTEQPAPFSLACPQFNISVRLERIVFKALEKEPSARFQSMAELRTALESVEQELLANSKSASEVFYAKRPNGNVEPQPVELIPLTQSIGSNNTASGANAGSPNRTVGHQTSLALHPDKRRLAVIAAATLGILALLSLSFQLGRGGLTGEEEEKKWERLQT